MKPITIELTKTEVEHLITMIELTDSEQYPYYEEITKWTKRSERIKNKLAQAKSKNK
jgi:hypothetical protein